MQGASSSIAATVHWLNCYDKRYSFGEQDIEDAISYAKRASIRPHGLGSDRREEGKVHLAQMPTAVLGFLIVCRDNTLVAGGTAGLLH